MMVNGMICMERVALVEKYAAAASTLYMATIASRMKPSAKSRAALAECKKAFADLERHRAEHACENSK